MSAMELNAIESGLLGPPRRLGETRDDPFHLLRRQCPRLRFQVGPGRGRRTHRLGDLGLHPHVAKLSDHPALLARLVDDARDSAKTVNEAIVADERHRVAGAAFRRHPHVAGDDEAHAAGGQTPIEADALLGHLALVPGVLRRRGPHQAVVNGEVPNPTLREDPVAGAA